MVLTALGHDVKSGLVIGLCDDYLGGVPVALQLLFQLFLGREKDLALGLLLGGSCPLVLVTRQDHLDFDRW